MDRFALEHLATSSLISESQEILLHQRRRTADLIARFAEIDRRRAYAEAGYSSMHAFCVSVFRLDDGEAFRRITAVRYALRFPGLFHAIAGERLHLTAVITIGPHLTPENANELIGAATHRTRRQIEEMLVARAPKPDLPERVRRLPVARSEEPAAWPGVPVNGDGGPGQPDQRDSAADRSNAAQLAPARVMSSPAPARVAPLASARFGLQVTISRETRDKLRRAQDLMAHTTPRGDLAAVLDRALDALIAQLESRKLAAAKRPWTGSPTASANPRHIPAAVKRAVRERDGDRCTFVADDGHRCEERSRLEFDHIVAIAKGGTSTVSNVRQLCRTHNQHVADRAFGVEFMRARRTCTVPAGAAPPCSAGRIG